MHSASELLTPAFNQNTFAGLSIDIPYRTFTLDNGLSVIVHEDHKAPIVSVNIWYHVGSKNEKQGKTGFAHLFEHLMFGGSEHMEGQYIDYLERVGATDLNGTTNEDRTNYFENVPKSAVDYVLFAESDRMGHFYNTISQEVLDTQRGVVQNEKRQGENEPYAIVEEMVVKATYPVGHPYDHTVIGSMEHLDAASLDDVKNWFKTYYTPSNAVLVISGAIDFESAKSKVSKYFGDIPAGPPLARQQSWIAKMSGNHRETVQDRVPQARIYKIWNVPEIGNQATDYLNLTASILTTGKSSRLYKRLVYDDQIATAVQAFVDQREIGSQFYIVATAKAGCSLKDIENAIDEELQRLLAEGPTAQELERVRTQSLANFVRGIERIGGFGGKSDILARSMTYFGNPDGYKTVLSRLEVATAAHLQATASEWLSDGCYTLEVHPFPTFKTTASAVDRSTIPELGAAPELSLPKLKRKVLSNGLRLILAERHEVPLVNLWLTFDAGYAADQFSLPGAARLTSSLLTSGTKNRTALQISDELQLLGAQLNASSNLDFTTVFLSSLKTKLEPSLQLFAEIVLSPSFPETDFARQQQLQLAAIEQEKAEPVGMALRVFPPLLYGHQHAYSTSFTGSGTAESVLKLTREQIQQFHQTWFRPHDATLIIVGDTSLDEISPKLETLFRDWKAGTGPSKAMANVPKPPKSVVYLLDKPGALQSTVFAGTLAPVPDATQEPVIETMNNILGGTFGARLNMNLREDKHWSYGAYCALFGAAAQRPYIAFASVQGDKTKESLAEIRQELLGITDSKPISHEELERSKLQQILELPGSRETMNAVGGSIAELVQFRFPDEYFDTYVQRIEGLTTNEVNEAASQLIDPERLVWVVVGDRSSIETGIRELNLGEMHFIDADGHPATE